MKETIVKTNKTKSWFFEKINKIDKPLARLIKKKIKKVREKNQTHKIRNEKGEVTTDNAKIQRIIRDSYEQLYGNKMDNLEEMDRFLGKFSLPRMNQEEIEIITTQLQAMKLSCDQKSPPRQKSRTRWLHRRILSTFSEDTCKTLSKNCRGRKTSKLIL